MRIYEITAATDPAEIQMLQRLSQRFGLATATSLEDLNNKLEQKLIDRCAKRVGLPPGSTVDQVLAAQKNYVKNVLPGIQANRAAELAKLKSYQGLSAQEIFKREMEILKREMPAIEQLKAGAAKALPAVSKATWLSQMGTYLGWAGKALGAVTGVGASLLTYSGGIDDTEDQRMAQMRQDWEQQQAAQKTPTK